MMACRIPHSCCCATARAIGTLKNLFTGWVDVDLSELGRARGACAAVNCCAGGRPPRRAAHHPADARDPHRELALDGLRPLVDPGAPLVAAERAALRRACRGTNKARDRGEVRRRAGARSGAALRHAAAAARRPTTADSGVDERYDALPPDVVPRAECLADVARPDAALLVRRASCPTSARAHRCSSPRTATRCARW